MSDNTISFPIGLAFEVLKGLHESISCLLSFDTLTRYYEGLEDFAEECVLEALGSWESETFERPQELVVSAPMFSGHVILHCQNLSSLSFCRECFERCHISCVKSAFLLVSDVEIEETRVLLQDAHTIKQRNGSSSKLARKLAAASQPLAEGTSIRVDQNIKNSPQSRSPSETAFLTNVVDCVRSAQQFLRIALDMIVVKERTFRGSAFNPSHYLPFDSLSTHCIAQVVGEAVYDWLQVDTPGLSTHDESSGDNRKWKVNLASPSLIVDLRIIGVPREVHRRSVPRGHQGTSALVPDSCPLNTRQPDFPPSLRLLLTIPLRSSVNRLHTQSGRTSLPASTAYILSRVHPYFSPLRSRSFGKSKLEHGVTLLDPCAGTGSIPFQMLRACQEVGSTPLVLCCDNQSRNMGLAAAAVRHSICQGYGIQIVTWDAAGTGGMVREASVDGVVTDLPYGHRELSFRQIKRLYPKILSNLASVCRPGAYAVLSTAAAPLLRRCISQQAAWKQVCIGWEQGPLEREVFIGGMRVWIFLLVNTSSMRTL